MKTLEDLRKYAEEATERSPHRHDDIMDIYKEAEDTVAAGTDEEATVDSAADEIVSIEQEENVVLPEEA